MPELLPFASITDVEFGVVRVLREVEDFKLVPTGPEVQNCLIDMLRSTEAALRPETGDFSDLDRYELSQKYESRAALTFSLAAGYTPWIANLVAAQSIATDPYGLASPERVIRYFARFLIDHGQKILAVRRASQFKSVLKARNRLVRYVDQTLLLIEEDVFRLDQDFDYLVFDGVIYILRPEGFAHAIDELLIQASARQTALALVNRLNFVDFGEIARLAADHPRVARLVIALNMRDDLGSTSQACLERECADSGVVLVPSHGKIAPAPGQELDFLEQLDRRRFASTLIPNVKEVYVASNRRRER
jgi:hypothetical protein